MKKIGLGKKGHLAISTNNINRALFYLKKSGLKELSETRNEKNGVLKSIYLDLEISGFAIHLLQK
jgi:2-dehydro-3-deoxyphosphogluconate aldolase/(4S)-4-hydroxy-2-oxoglutarate aldolase